MTTMLKQGCDVCGKEFEAATQGELNRNLSVHKRFAHGIKGKGKRSLSAVIATPDSKNNHLDPKVLERRKYQKQWRINRMRKLRAMQRTERPEQPKERSHQVIECKLSSCPACGARFYLAKGEVE